MLDINNIVKKTTPTTSLPRIAIGEKIVAEERSREERLELMSFTGQTRAETFGAPGLGREWPR